MTHNSLAQQRRAFASYERIIFPRAKALSDHNSPLQNDGASLLGVLAAVVLRGNFVSLAFCFQQISDLVSFAGSIGNARLYNSYLGRDHNSQVHSQQIHR